MLPFLTPVFLSCLRRAPVMVPSPRQSHCGLRCKRATGTFALRCGADFPRLNNPPLETAKKGELRFPLLGTSPRLLRWRLSGGGGLRCNAPAAPACMGENWGTVLERRGGLYGRPACSVGADAHIGPPYSGLKRLPWEPFSYLFSCHASGGPLSEWPERGERAS